MGLLDQLTNDRNIYQPPATERSGEQRKETTHMPELLVDFITSLDGYGAADGWPGL
ncbi:MAG: hypothetical protein JWL72_4682, partial [Ilumatobacteraceae bacterium]|nr:hypothetical protein [Ilumatobacteraceae bacterium]